VYLPKHLSRSIYSSQDPCVRVRFPTRFGFWGASSGFTSREAHPASRLAPPQTPCNKRPSSSATTPIDNHTANIRYTRLYRRSAIVVVADSAPLYTTFLPSDSNCIDCAVKQGNWKFRIATDLHTAGPVSANTLVHLVDRDQSLQITTQPGCAVAHWLDRTTRSTTSITQNGVNRCRCRIITGTWPLRGRRRTYTYTTITA
jgi:hypothetical protein